MLRNQGDGLDAGAGPRTTNRQHMEVTGLEVKDRELGTLTELDPESLDPAFSYRWVYKAPLKVSRMRQKGYVVVVPSEEKILNIIGDSPEAVDGTFTCGDTILMKTPKVRFVARRRKNKRRTDARLEGPTKRFKRAARDAGRKRGKNIEVIRNKDPQGGD